MYDRAVEIARYTESYKDPRYRMGDGRYFGAQRVLDKLPRGWLLDIGAGRGELARVADKLGFQYRGLEPAAPLDDERIVRGIATAIPCLDRAYDVVACLDVIEHLVPEDVRPALEEMLRAADKYVLLTAANFSHMSTVDGKDLHISKRSIPEWQKLFEDVFAGHKIEYLGKLGVSPGWLITLQDSNAG